MAANPAPDFSAFAKSSPKIVFKPAMIRRS
jgi:hypothetical protein